MDIKKEHIEALFPSITIATLAYVLRVVFARRKVTVSEFLIDALAAVAMGLVVGNIVTAYVIPESAKLAMVAMSGFIGPDLLSGLLTVTRAFKDSPDQFLLKYIYAIRGVKTGMDTMIEKPSPKPDIKVEPVQDSPNTPETKPEMK